MIIGSLTKLVERYGEELLSDWSNEEVNSPPPLLYVHKPFTHTEYVDRIVAFGHKAFDHPLNNQVYESPSITRSSLVQEVSQVLSRYFSKGLDYIVRAELHGEKPNQKFVEEFKISLALIREFFDTYHQNTKAICLIGVDDIQLSVPSIRGSLKLRECRVDPEKLIYAKMERLYVNGNLAIQRADFDAANEAYGRTLELSKEAGNTYYQSMAIGGLGRVQQANENFPEALKYFAKAYIVERSEVIMYLDDLCGRQDLKLCQDDWSERLRNGNAEILAP